MEERQERNNCCICGEDIYREGRHEGLCEECHESWARETETQW